MTKEEEDMLRNKCREVLKLSNKQTEHYIQLCKLARAANKEAFESALETNERAPRRSAQEIG